MSSLLRRVRLDGASAAAAAVGAALVLVVGFLVVRSDPRSEFDLRLSDGAVWLASTPVGGISLLDGGSGTIAVSLGVAEPGDDFDVEQFGSDAIVVNRTDGTVAKLDGRSWSITTGRVQFGEPGAPMAVITGRSHAWVATPGQVMPIEASQLAGRTPIPVADAFADGVVTDAGDLVFAGGDPGDPVRIFPESGGDPIDVGGIDGPVRLAQLGTAVAGVDLDDLRVWLDVDEADGGEVVCERLEFPDGSALHAGGGEGRMLVVSDSGGAFTWDPRASGCPGAADFINLGPGRYGRPAVTDGWAVVPEIATGAVVVIDLEAPGVTARQDLEGVADGTEVSLVAENGAIWYNDPTSASAGLIRRDGSVVPVSKYEEGTSGFAAAPIGDAPDDAEFMSVAGPEVTQPEREDEEPPPEAEAEVAPQEEAATTTTSTTQPGSGGGTAATSTPTTDPGGPEPTTDTTDGGSTTETTDGGGTGTTDTTDGGGTGTTETTGTSTTEPPDEGVVITMGVSALQATVGETINFTAITQHGEPNNWDWAVSPQGPELQPIESFGSFRFLFEQAGTYTVTLTACDPDDNCDDATVRVEIVEDPDAVPLVAGIDAPTQTRVGETLTLRDASQGDPDSWSWSIQGGNPSTATSRNVQVSWDTEGTKTVQLRVERDGRLATTEHEVLVLPELTEPAPFGLTCTPTSLDAGDNATCRLDGTVADFSDIRFSTSPGAPSVTSSQPSAGRLVLTHGIGGDVTVTLTAVDNGTGDTVTDTAVVSFAPIVICTQAIPQPNIIGPVSLEVGEEGTYRPDLTGCGTVTYSWTAQGSASISAPSNRQTRISWSQAGVYQVRLGFSDGSGPGAGFLTVTVTDPTPVVGAPEVQVTGPNNLETGASGNFGITNSGGTIDAYSWTTTGGGGSSSTAGLNATWNSPGTYQVRIEVSGPGGTDVATRSVTVTDPAPEPSPFGVTCDQGTANVDEIFTCQLAGAPSNFSNPSWTTSAGALSWYMDDWTTDVAGTSAGSVTVTLSATDLATGQTVTDSVTVSIVEPAPQPSPFGVTCNTGSAEVDSIFRCQLAGDGANFSNPNWSTSAGANSWFMSDWVFDVAGTSPGSVTVTLSATDLATGQTVSDSVTVTITAPAPQPATLTIGCSVSSAAIGERFNCQLTSGNAGSFTGLSWAVSPAAHQRWGSGSSLDVAGTAAGTLTIVLTGTDNGTGQTVSDSATVTITG